MHVQIEDRGQAAYEDRVSNAWKASAPSISIAQRRLCKTDSRGNVEDGEVDCEMADGSRMRVPLAVMDSWNARKADAMPAGDACTCDDNGQSDYEARISNAWRNTPATA